MKINFEHSDEFMDALNSHPKIVDLAEFLIQNPSLISNAAFLIRDGFSVERFKVLKTNLLLKDMANRKLQEFIDKVNEVYELANSLPEGYFGNHFMPHDKVNKIRGSILETLIKVLLDKRHSIVKQNCRINIDDCIQSIPGNLPQTMDVVGIDQYDNPQEGAFYEVKVGFKSINKNDFLFIGHLRQQLCDSCPSIVVGLVSFEGKAAINGLLKRLRLDLSYLKYVVTYEGLHHLWTYTDVKKLIS